MLKKLQGPEMTTMIFGHMQLTQFLKKKNLKNIPLTFMPLNLGNRYHFAEQDESSTQQEQHLHLS